MRTRPIHDTVALLARTGVGVVFVVHGWKKIQAGIDATGHDFHALHVPLPTAAAVYSTFVELLGGTALIVGLGLPIVGVLLFLDMVGALVFVNGSHGLLIGNRATDLGHQGFEFVLVLGLVSLLFAVGGGGRFTLDQRLFGRRRLPSEFSEDEETDRWLDTLNNRATQELEVGRTQELERGGKSKRSKGFFGRRPAGEKPAPVPAATPAPRLASEIVEDPNHDVLVARHRPAEPMPDPEADDAEISEEER